MCCLQERTTLNIHSLSAQSLLSLLAVSKAQVNESLLCHNMLVSRCANQPKSCVTFLLHLLGIAEHSRSYTRRTGPQNAFCSSCVCMAPFSPFPHLSAAGQSPLWYPGLPLSKLDRPDTVSACPSLQQFVLC